jgi:hypothetical protein
VFQPYTREQLKEIVHSRLEGIQAFDPRAIHLCAAKVSPHCSATPWGKSGDASPCRRPQLIAILLRYMCKLISQLEGSVWAR